MIDPRKESARVEKAYQQWQSFRSAYDYAAGTLSGEIVATAERIEAAERFFRDLLNPAYDIRMKPPEFVIRIIERTIKHNQGEKLDGTPLKGTPLILEPWQVFVVVNLLCFYKAGTNERRFKEAFVYVPRKNGKTLLDSLLTFYLPGKGFAHTNDSSGTNQMATEVPRRASGAWAVAR